MYVSCTDLFVESRDILYFSYIQRPRVMVITCEFRNEFWFEKTRLMALSGGE